MMIDKPPLIVDYTNIAIIFGYIGMFSTIFPLVPVIALCGFYFKLNGDVIGLSRFFKRCPAQQAGSIGIWNFLFKVINY